MPPSWWVNLFGIMNKPIVRDIHQPEMPSSNGEHMIYNILETVLLFFLEALFESFISQL
jgi:hypothetical protein